MGGTDGHGQGRGRGTGERVVLCRPYTRAKAVRPPLLVLLVCETYPFIVSLVRMRILEYA